jgi:hypothetical protein
MLARSEDYARQQPSLTKRKQRRLEITAGAPKRTRTAAAIWSTNRAIREAERQLAVAGRDLLSADGKDQQAGAPARKVGVGVTPERA